MRSVDRLTRRSYTHCDTFGSWAHGVNHDPQFCLTTAGHTGRYGPVPAAGVVFAGAGAVSDLPTHGIPVLFPKSTLL